MVSYQHFTLTVVAMLISMCSPQCQSVLELLVKRLGDRHPRTRQATSKALVIVSRMNDKVRAGVGKWCGVEGGCEPDGVIFSWCEHINPLEHNK